MKRNVEIINDLTFVGYNFIMKERKIISCHNNTPLHLHIETVNLTDGDYKLVPSDSVSAEIANLNGANLNQDLGQALEDSQTFSAQEGKPRCIIPLFSELLFILLFVCVVIFLLRIYVF